jgi:hypothetical protein
MPREEYDEVCVGAAIDAVLEYQPAIDLDMGIPVNKGTFVNAGIRNPVLQVIVDVPVNIQAGCVVF